MNDFEWNMAWMILFRFSINLVAIAILLRFIYERSGGKRAFTFNYAVMSVVAFLVCFFLGNTRMSLGIGIGLFAIFAIFRYRTDKIQVREMAYLFISVGLSVINSLHSIDLGYIAMVNILVIGSTFLFEIVPGSRKPSKPSLQHCRVVFENLKNLDPSKEKLLFKELNAKTGLHIQKVKIEKIEIEKHRVHLKIYF